MFEAALCALERFFLPIAVSIFLMFIMHGLIVPFKGLDFGFYDEPTESRIGTYSAIALVVALMGGMILGDSVMQIFWN